MSILKIQPRFRDCTFLLIDYRLGLLNRKAQSPKLPNSTAKKTPYATDEPIKIYEIIILGDIKFHKPVTSKDKTAILVKKVAITTIGFKTPFNPSK